MPVGRLSGTLVLILMIGGALAYMGQAHIANGSAGSSGQFAVEQTRAVASVAAVDVGECARDDATFAPTTLPAGTVSDAAARAKVAELGASGAPAIVAPVLATVGVKPGQAPTQATIQKDQHGASIAARPAWVVVFRNQHILVPSGSALAAQKTEHYIGSVLGIVDASTGEFLKGWGCSWAP